MASAIEHTVLETPRFDHAPHVLIVASPYYRSIADHMIQGAVAELKAANATYEIVNVPGALELPTAIRLAAKTRSFDGFIAIGCVIRGETTHYEIVSEESARGLTELGFRDGICLGNGVLTVESMEQAIVRADPKEMNKGGGAATAALHLIAFAQKCEQSPRSGSFAPDEEHILMAAAQTPGRTA